MADLCDLVDYLVVSREDVVSELNLSDGTQSVDPHPERDRCNAAFRERRIEDAVASELILKTF